MYVYLLHAITRNMAVKMIAECLQKDCNILGDKEL